MFREQAEADFRAALSVPRRDLPGQAIGISMFLAQQCVEKQPESIILGINGALDLEKGDRFLPGLGHRLCPTLHKIRGRFVKRPGMPPAPVLRHMDPGTAGGAFAGNGRVPGGMGRVWEKYAAPTSRIRMCVWKHSPHAGPDPGELADTNRFLRGGLVGLPGTLGRRGAASRPPGSLTNDLEPPPPMREVTKSQAGTDAAYSEYTGGRRRAGMRKLRDAHVATQDRIFPGAGLACLGELERGMRGRAAARLVAEFAFEAASFQAYRYVVIYPHNLLGRYPERLPDGRTTTEVYASGADIALHRLCNEARFGLDLLRGHRSKLDELCGLGREHGYW